NVILLERVRSERMEVRDSAGPARLYWERRVQPIEPLRQAALATAPFTLPVVPIPVGQFWTFGRPAGDTPNLPAVALHASALPLQQRLMDVLAESKPALAARLAAIPPVNLQETIRELRGMTRADEHLAGYLLQHLDGTDLLPEDRRRLRALMQMYGGPDSRYL